MPGPAAPRRVLVDETSGLPIFGTGSAGGGGTSPANPSSVSIVGSGIALPVDVQSLYRVQIILTSAVLAANGIYTSPATDALNFRRITGRVQTDQAGVLYVSQSDDNVIFDNVVVQNCPIGMTAYDVVMYLRYVKITYVNGAVAQTAFRLSGYLAAA